MRKLMNSVANGGDNVVFNQPNDEGQLHGKQITEVERNQYEADDLDFISGNYERDNDENNDGDIITSDSTNETEDAVDDIENDPTNDKVGETSTDNDGSDGELDTNIGEPWNPKSLDEEHAGNDLNEEEDHEHNMFEINEKTVKKFHEPIKDDEKTGSHVDQGDIMFDKCEEEKEFGISGNLPNPACKDVLLKARKKAKVKLQQRDAMTWKKSLWEMPISVIFSNNLNQQAKKAIFEAVAEYRKKTCIRFTSKRKRDHLYVFAAQGRKEGCWSGIGRRGGRQMLSLSNGCETKNTAIHEIMHALGFWHEISRGDRDKFVQINWDNIRTEPLNYKSQFAARLEGVTTYGFGYDYKSTMHYESDAFGKPVKDWRGQISHKVTITPIVHTALGQCKTCGLSKIDALQLNARYCNRPKNLLGRKPLRELTTRWAAIYEGQSHDIFRNTLLKHLALIYPRYVFVVSSYDTVRNRKHHGTRGACLGVHNEYGRNVVVCYVKRRPKRTFSWRMTKIVRNIKRGLSGKSCSAKYVLDHVKNAAGQYRRKIRGIVFVKYGYNLRSKWNNGQTKFLNYKCERNGDASLVIIFK